ncbi:MAG: hypothetical protein IT305_07050 [Chloroflexi bacterium]|nr:hypothetical protein [Chloroflexota bacterium]
MDEPFDEALAGSLARSLDLLETGGSLDVCLEGVPNGGELLSLLEIADALRQAPSHEPDPTWLRQSRDRIWFLASSRRIRRTA